MKDGGDLKWETNARIAPSLLPQRKRILTVARGQGTQVELADSLR